MDISIALPTSGSWATPANVTAIAQAAERSGCRGVWTFQRVLYPVGTDMPSVYESVLDPLIALAFAAASTHTVRLGVAVVNAPFTAPPMLAKQISTLDVLSGGRLDAGLGLGWLDAEYAAVGLSMRQRGRRFDEYLDCLDVLLTQDPAEFHGEYYFVPPAHQLPRPVQRPRPPILVGGSSEAAYRRAGARGDGFVSSSRASITDVQHAMRVAADAADAAGRPEPRCVVRGVTRVRPEAPTERGLLEGSVEQIGDDLAAYGTAGIDEVFLDVNFDSAQVGSPDADPARAMDKAYAVLALVDQVCARN